MSWLWALAAALVRRLVGWRLGPYRVRVNTVDAAAPRQLSSPRRVAVVGGGLAGIAAASTLGERGYQVTLFEAKPHLGGKLGSWQVELSPTDTQWVSHGFHAFFRHYYNLNRFLTSLGAHQKFKGISDYRILVPGGGEISFGEMEKTPVLNLLKLSEQGVYRLGEVFRAPTRDALSVFLAYDPALTPSQLDGMSFAEFDRRAQLPKQLKLAFNTFARAFFADESKLSLAELVKSFHFYFLGHDGGLVYDYPASDYEASLLAPIRHRLQQWGVQLRLGTPVTGLARTAAGFTVNAEPFDAVVLASDVAGTRKVLEAARGLEALDPRLRGLVPGQRYAVLRLWLDKQPRAGLPVFVITDRVQVLDAIAFYDRTETESAAWVEKNGGAVVELHCYAVPDAMSEARVRELLLEELRSFLPELKDATLRHEWYELRQDFTAFHVGMHSQRPGTESGVPGLYCAGDWVKLPFPAMLMEAAFSSGLVAANKILATDGLQEEPVESVPLRGLLAGVPRSPAQKRLLEG
ncbi:MAG: FAD-dependent oxidoreductase [Myxococcota bacterium]|nr:FAD-dependent oxidoreductase [Myxococcota bacterium]